METIDKCTGDDVMQDINIGDCTLEANRPLSQYKMISANAYMGIEGLMAALETGADIIVAGWVADPWKKEVPNLATLGYPIAEVNEEGAAVFSKVDGTGGVINLATVKEQLLYEVTDPTGYMTPDVIADFTQVQLREIAPDQVQVWRGVGKGKPSQLKVSVGCHAGFIGEGEISYGGANALARAKLAGDVIQERLHENFTDLRIDYIGISSVYRTNFGQFGEPYEIRLRVAGRASTKEQAERIGEEVETLYTNGPAGGGGARKYVHEVIGIVSVLIPREKVTPQVTRREC